MKRKILLLLLSLLALFGLECLISMGYQFLTERFGWSEGLVIGMAAARAMVVLPIIRYDFQMKHSEIIHLI